MDHYGLTNVTRSASNAKEDTLSQSNISAFLDKDVEARNYYSYSEEKKEDNFSDSNANIKEFKVTLLIPNGKDDENTPFYSICYAIRSMRTDKSEKCEHDEL